MLIDVNNGEPKPLAFDDPIATVSKRGRFIPTLKEWATRYARPRDNPQGDFIEDLRCDRRFDDGDPPQSWDDLHCYLLVRGACREAIAAGRRVWTNYDSWCRRNSTKLPAKALEIKSVRAA